MNRKVERNSSEDSRANRVGEILQSRFESHKTGYVHPATARRQELIRQGWSVIATGITLDAMKKAAGRKEYSEGAVWLTMGDVLAPPAKSQNKKDAA
jgi:hypothetical protein